MRIELEITTSAGRQTFAHSGPVVRIGRNAGCELSLQGAGTDSVSGQHARIDLTPQRVTLADTKSRNGTLLNERAITAPTPLHAGDRINLGYAGPRLRVVALDLAPAPAVWRQRPVLAAAALLAGLLLALLGSWGTRGFRQPTVEPELAEVSLPETPRPASSEKKGPPSAPAPVEPAVKTAVSPTPEPARPRTDPPPAAEVDAAPATAVVAVGKYAAGGSEPSLLLQRAPAEPRWSRVDAGKPEVHTNSPLAALPGFQGEILLDIGLRLRLWGILPEQIHLQSPVRESLVVLHPPRSADLDMTLQRGRVLISNPGRRPAVALVRFSLAGAPGAAERWEIRLEEDTEVLLEKWSMSLQDTPATPLSTGHILIRRGKVRLQVPDRTLQLQAPPGKSYARWVGTVTELAVEKLKDLPGWSDEAPAPPAALEGAQRQAYDKARQDLQTARAALARTVEASDQEAALALRTALGSSDAPLRVLAVRGLGAVDDLPALIGALDDGQADVRQTAAETLRLWQGHGPDHVSQLRAALPRAEAATIAALLRDLTAQEAAQKETYAELVTYLTHPRLAVRELAAWQLYLGLPRHTRGQAGVSIQYDPAGTLASRQTAQQAWLRLIEQGKLPPRPAGR